MTFRTQKRHQSKSLKRHGVTPPFFFFCEVRDPRLFYFCQKAEAHARERDLGASVEAGRLREALAAAQRATDPPSSAQAKEVSHVGLTICRWFR
jgi:hypothetical protein